MTFVETILHASAGTSVTVSPDLVVVNDGGAYAAAEHAKTVKYPERVRVIYDHDVPTGRPESSRIFGVLRTFAKANGIHLIQAKGVGYQYLLTHEVQPGQIVLQGGRHAGIYGSMGALGLSCDADVLTAALENGSLTMTVPETVCVKLTGSLADGVSVMDAAMTLLRDCGTLPGKAVELDAPMLTKPEQAILCAMACESGAVTVAVTDHAMADFTLDLSDVIPMVTMPCDTLEGQNQAVRQPLEALEGMTFHAGQIGGYTGGTIEELRKAAAALEGHQLTCGFRLSIVPATDDDFLQAMDEGLITRFIDYGAQIQAVGDRSRVVQGAGAMGDNERLLTTGLYTDTGCMGVDTSRVYTASAESVARASFAGEEA